MQRIWLCCCLLLLIGCVEKAPPDSGINLNAALGGIADAGFARATQPRPFSFPQDHAAHPDFRNEWWYVTGNLTAENGQAFGYQVTFFRIALSPQAPAMASDWASNQVWMVHVALTDVQQQTHYDAQRFVRGAAGLAGQSTQPFRVWAEDWQMVGNGQGDFPWAIGIKTEDFALNLQLRPSKPVVLQGNQGLSQKSAEAGNASYYYSLTRLNTLGDLQVKGQYHRVMGQSWLDREWSTSALGKQQAGWDWFSLQFNDGHDLMFYRLRKQDGSSDAHSSGKWIDAQGNAQTLTQAEVRLTPIRYWQDSQGRRYPVAWRMQIPHLGQDFKVSARVDDQQMNTAVLYWEGAVSITDSQTDKPLGLGYLELSGY